MGTLPIAQGEISLPVSRAITLCVWLISLFAMFALDWHVVAHLAVSLPIGVAHDDQHRRPLDRAIAGLHDPAAVSRDRIAIAPLRSGRLDPRDDAMTADRLPDTVMATPTRYTAIAPEGAGEAQASPHFVDDVLDRKSTPSNDAERHSFACRASKLDGLRGR